MYTYQFDGMYILTKHLLMGRSYVPACPPHIHCLHGMSNSILVWKANHTVALFMKQLMHAEH